MSVGSDTAGLVELLRAGRLPGGALGQWVTPDDLLIGLVRNSLAGVSLAINARLWNPVEGVHEINELMTPTSDRSLNTFSFGLHYGYLVSAVIKATAGSPHRGQTLATMLLARPPAAAFAPKVLLAQDYVTTQYGPLYPGGKQGAGVDGQGALFSFSVAQPAAGADWVQTVPTGARWILHGIYATLATAIAVANRQPLLLFDDGTNKLVAANTALVQAASLTEDWAWSPTVSTTGLFQSNVNEVQLPFPVPLSAGWRVRTLTGAIQAADQWSAIRLLVEEWLED